MKYFGITGNIASILGFFTTIYMLKTSDISNAYLWGIFGFIFATIVFWVWFYLKPNNPIAKTIDSKMDFSGKYIDSKEISQDVVEGCFEVDTRNWGTSVSLPPFEKPPKISIISSHCKERPEIKEITTDSFRVKIWNSDQSGTWKWRARGKLLKRVNYEM